jgi:hypothetical protein
MDTYNRRGYSYDVFQLWDSLIMSSSKESDLLVNNATVSIVWIPVVLIDNYLD